VLTDPREGLINRIETVEVSRSGCEATTGQAKHEANTASGSVIAATLWAVPI